MSEQLEVRPVDLKCTGPRQHRFERELLCWVHYVRGEREPVFWRVKNTTGVFCPECGATAEQVIT